MSCQWKVKKNSKQKKKHTSTANWKYVNAIVINAVTKITKHIARNKIPNLQKKKERRKKKKEEKKKKKG